MKKLWTSVWILAAYIISLATPMSGQNLISFKYDTNGKTHTGFVHVMFFTNKDKEVTPFPQCEVPQLNFFGTERKGVKAHFSGLKWADTSHAANRLVIKPSPSSRLGGLSLHTKEAILQEGRSRELKYSVTGEGEGEIRIDLKILTPNGVQQVGSVSQDYTIFNQAVAVTQIEKSPQHPAKEVDVVFANNKKDGSKDTKASSNDISAPVAEMNPAEKKKVGYEPTLNPQNTPSSKELADKTIAENIIEAPEEVQLVYAELEGSGAETASDHETGLIPVVVTESETPDSEISEATPFVPVEDPAEEVSAVAQKAAPAPVLTERKTTPVETKPEINPDAEKVSSGWGEVIMYLVGWPVLFLGGIWMIFLLGKYLVEQQKIKRQEKLQGANGNGQAKQNLDHVVVISPNMNGKSVVEEEEDLFEKLVTEGGYLELKMDRLWVDSAVAKVFVHQDMVGNLEPILQKAKDTSQEITGFLLGGHQYNDVTEQFMVTTERFVPFRSPDGSDSPSLADHVLQEMDEVNGMYPDLAVTGLLSVRPGTELSLSARDQAIFQGLFGQRYQVIIQVDPLSKNIETSVFSKTRSGRLNITEDRIASRWLNWPSPVKQS